MSEEKDNKMNTKDFFIGAMIGGLLGASCALLLAPKPGRELRADIHNQARAAKEKTIDLTQQAVEKSNQFASTAKQSTTNFAKTVTDQSAQLLTKVKDLAKLVKKDVVQLTESADQLDDFEGVNEDIAASVKKEVEELQRSVEQLIKEVEEQEKNKNL